MPLNSSQTLDVILRQHQIPTTMIKIVNDQRITYDDLKEITRDDVDHLFKNDSGFKFRDRKLFWITIQKIRSSNINNGNVISMNRDEDLSNLYTPIDDDIQIMNPVYFNPTIVTSQKRRENLDDVRKTLNCQTISRDEVDHHGHPSVTSALHGSARFSSTRSNFCFMYPVELPTFSDPVQRALQSQSIDGEWKNLIGECTQWILSKKTNYIEKREIQAIGRTLFDKCPSIAKSGFRPWSHFCRCLSASLRLERRRRVLSKS